MKWKENEKMIDFNKTHCDRCHLEVNKGEGIFAEGGFYHINTCYEELKQEYVDSYEWEELKTFQEPEAVCPYCGYADGDSWELNDNDDTTTCGRCDREYKYARNVNVTYTTEPIGE